MSSETGHSDFPVYKNEITKCSSDAESRCGLYQDVQREVRCFQAGH
jgi:hypothetical protein